MKTNAWDDPMFDLRIKSKREIYSWSSDLSRISKTIGGDWLVVFRLNGPLRQYFSLHRAVSQREGERMEMTDERGNVQTHTRTYCKRNRPLPYYKPN